MGNGVVATSQCKQALQQFHGCRAEVRTYMDRASGFALQASINPSESGKLKYQISRRLERGNIITGYINTFNCEVYLHSQMAVQEKRAGLALLVCEPSKHFVNKLNCWDSYLMFQSNLLASPGVL